MCYKKPEQPVYMFDEQFKQQWYSFLEQKADNLELNPAPTRVFLTRFKYSNWQKSRGEIWQEADVNSSDAFIRQLTNVFAELKQSCPEIGPGAGNFPIAKRYLLEEFRSIYFKNLAGNLSRQVEDSRGELFQRERQECHQAIAEPGALIRIKAPTKMGKSRLFNHVLNYANEQQYNTVHINLLQLEKGKLKNLEQFIRWFCIYLSDDLNLDFNLDDHWSSDRGTILSFKRYLEAILYQLEQPLVIGLDEADRLLKYPDISQDFFYLLRSLHEDANNEEVWEKLRLIIVYSTEDFGNLDINRSPFNVGLPIELKSIERSQLIELADFYNIKLLSDEVELLMSMLGGHPYLIDLFLSHLSASKSTVEELLQQAVTNEGIYDSYLRHHLDNLNCNSQLTDIFVRVLDSTKAVQVDTLLGYQLYRMGLIKWSKNNTVIPSCELFRQYFLPRLKVN